MQKTIISPSLQAHKYSFVEDKSLDLALCCPEKLF